MALLKKKKSKRKIKGILIKSPVSLRKKKSNKVVSRNAAINKIFNIATDFKIEVIHQTENLKMATKKCMKYFKVKSVRFNDVVEIEDAPTYNRRNPYFRPPKSYSSTELRMIFTELNYYKNHEMVFHRDSAHLLRFHRL